MKDKQFKKVLKFGQFYEMKALEYLEKFGEYDVEVDEVIAPKGKFSEYDFKIIKPNGKNLSYEIKNKAEKDIIPCAGRVLTEGCYLIEVKFTKLKAFSSNKKLLLFLMIGVFFLLMVSIFYKKKQLNTSDEKNSPFESLGSYQFYPEQNKLVKKAIEINLSKKECELLEILVANSNQIVKRDELTKRIWEDNGVIVGRSLDTYISKLRKKLKDDASIKITNVHGVGYKLEINNN